MNNLSAQELLSNMRALAEQAQSGSKPSVSPVQTGDNQATSFADLFSSAINKVNELSQETSQLRTQYEKGDEGVDLAEVMVASQKSSVAFQALVQVRNRVVTAYQDIMNMQV